jgi:putative two-component system response regulator
MDLDPVTRFAMFQGALFHDLGKIVVPDAVLLKPGPLTADERVVIQKHPAVGTELLAPMKTMARTLPFVHAHHERLDGSGYPDGLNGDSLPREIRIVTVCDVFDALTTTRAYRRALSHEEAYEILSDEVRRGWWDGEVLGELQAAVAEMGTHPTPEAEIS